jgi:hypothetical protein
VRFAVVPSVVPLACHARVSCSSATRPLSAECLRLNPFLIWFGAWQEFNGYLYSWDKGLMSGVTYWGGSDFGFTAARQG